MLQLLQESDAQWVIGTDETGFGAWAGPLLVCGVIAPRTWEGVKGLRDSKKMTETQLESVYKAGRALPGIRSVTKVVSPKEIDSMGARKALIAAHKDVIFQLLKLESGKSLVVSDGNMKIEGAVSIPKADDLVPSVSMASVFAKVERDRMMVELHERFPNYAFNENVGYGTKAHQAGLNQYGPCEIHRMSYDPVRKAALAINLKALHTLEDI